MWPQAVPAQASCITPACRQFPVPFKTLKEETIMKDKTQDAPPELTLAERRKRLADALGFLLARAWLREKGQSQQDSPASAQPADRQTDSAPRPP
jgi:hypothetical protein